MSTIILLSIIVGFADFYIFKNHLEWINNDHGWFQSIWTITAVFSGALVAYSALWGIVNFQ